MLHCILEERGSHSLRDIFSGDLGEGVGVDTGLETEDIFDDNHGEPCATQSVPE